MEYCTWGPGGHWFMKKNFKSKISCQTPFKVKIRVASYNIIEFCVASLPAMSFNTVDKEIFYSLFTTSDLLILKGAVWLHGFFAVAWVLSKY